ncbi:hypothetical protein LEP1GSC041_3062 [Leptospira noguchii str. 2006001870]|uniref:SWIM zinc finger family protein n=2 Tax=Leptospira TaxID=171 RepID=UPI000297B86A|nr:hypothetical protein [Leptospira noguchii]EKR74845.1 hypothetical protein LEP1GSC041_3062 [Leptospira noguchii str. 2006001870]
MLSLKKAKEALSQITRLLPSDVIIKRGIELYNSGDVHDLIETKRNHYHTKVLGNSALYELEIQISSPQKTKVLCDCPYDMDVYCKHAVAAILKIVFSGIINRKNETKQPELSEILPNISQKDFVKFLLQKADSDPSFYKELVTFFSRSDSKSRASYLEEVTQIYHSFLDEYGFVDYQTSFKFKREMNRFLDQAKRLYPTKPKEALYIASACAEIALEASMNMDDSNDFTMDLVVDTLEMIQKLVRKNPNLHDEIFEICLHLYQHKSAQDFGYSYDYYNIIMYLDLDSNRLKKLKKILEQKLNQAINKPYRIEKVAIEIYKLFQKSGQSTEGIDFLNSYVEYPQVRKIFIEQAISKKQFLHAKELILRGIQIAKKEKKSETVNQWKNELLNLMKRQGNMKSALKIAKELFLDLYQDNYKNIIKQNLSKADWKKESNSVAKFIVSNSKNINERNAIRFLLEEGFSKEAFQIIETKNSSLFFQLYKEFVKIDQKQTIKIGINYVEKEAVHANSRNQYKRLVQTMKQIASSPEGKNSVSSLTKRFSLQYSHRSAMLEELKKGKFI